MAFIVFFGFLIFLIFDKNHFFKAELRYFNTFLTIKTAFATVFLGGHQQNTVLLLRPLTDKKPAVPRTAST